MMSLLLILSLALQDAPEKKVRDHAWEMRQECAAALGSIEGVASVGVGGSAGDYRILIVVRDARTQEEVRDLIGSDTYGGVRIVWSIAAPPRPPALEPPPAEKPKVPPPDPLPEFPNFWEAKATDCDIIRDHLKMKKVQHPAGNGKSWVPCQLMNRTEIGPGGGHSFQYTNHRPDCPIRLGRVAEPPWADNFVAWVFRQGITAPTGTNFTLPGNAWAWAAQAGADMGSRIPNLRAGVTTGPTWVAGPGWMSPLVPVYVPPYYYSGYYRYWHWRPCWHAWHFHWRFR